MSRSGIGFRRPTGRGWDTGGALCHAGAMRFEVICEIEPAVTADLRRVRHQVGVLAPVATAFLVPDNHLGRATVSSIAVAHEVLQMGGRALACLNARDRNTLGFQRDLLTASAYGVEEFLFVYGDRPETGRRSDDLTVQAMLRHARSFSTEHEPSRPLRLGVSSGQGALPEWKHGADMLFAQVSFCVDELIAWRRRLVYAGPVYAGVLTVASASKARKLSASNRSWGCPPGSSSVSTPTPPPGWTSPVSW